MNLVLSPEMRKELYKKKLQILWEKSHALDNRLAQLQADSQSYQNDKQAFDKEFVELGLEVLGKDPKDPKASMNIIDVMKVLND